MDLSGIDPLLLLASLMVAATPILLAALGELVVERAGVLNLGVEGMMIAGAIVGFISAATTGSATLGFVGAPGAGPNALAAPQAALISALAKGVLGGDLNWAMIGWGALAGAIMVVVDELLGRAGRLRLPPLGIGLGIYLPMTVTLPVVLGAVIGSVYDRWAKRQSDPEAAERFTVLAGRFQEAEVALRGGTDPADYYAMTAELDSRLDEAAANPYLVSTLRTLRLHLARLRRLAADDPARLAASAAEHADIANAVGSGAADLAEATTRVHLHHAFHHLTRRGRAEETPTLLTPTEGDRP